MAYQITTIRPNGEYLVGTTNDEPKVQQLIKEGLEGGWMEYVPHFERYGNERCVAICDEEGKGKGLAVNPRATYLWYACLAPEPFIPDQLHGPVVIVTADTEAELRKL